MVFGRGIVKEGKNYESGVDVRNIFVVDSPDTNVNAKRVIVQAILKTGTWTSMNVYKRT